MEKGTSASEDAGLEGGWIVRSYISWGGEQNTLYKGVETSPYQTHFKNLERKPKRENSKRTISASGGLGSLQMVLEADTGQCASEETEPQRRVDHIDWRKERVPARTQGLEEGWIVKSHISWGRERNTFYKGMETSP